VSSHEPRAQPAPTRAMSSQEDPPSTCKLAFTNCYLGLPESLYLPTVPRAFTQCPCSTSLCDPVNSNLAVHHPLPIPPSPLNCRPTNYHTSYNTHHGLGRCYPRVGVECIRPASTRAKVDVGSRSSRRPLRYHSPGISFSCSIPHNAPTRV
jgi:hypothetical protein